MHGYLVLGVIHLWGCAYAQQYGPAPARVQQFSGASLVEPGRGSLRQRAGSPKAIPEIFASVDHGQVGQLRRAQPLRKIKGQFGQAQIADQQRNNLIDDAPASFTNKIVAPTPVAQYQTQAPKLTPRPVEEQVNEDDEIPTTVVTTPSTTTYTVPARSSYPPAPAPAPAPVPVSVPVAVPLQPNQVPVPFQRPQFIQPSAFRPAIPQPVQPVQYAAPALQGRQLIRQQGRPGQGVAVQAVSPPIPVHPQAASEDEQYFRQLQGRPLKKQDPVRQQVIDREPVRQQQLPRQPELVRQQQPLRAQTDYLRPAQREPHIKAPQRERKPVAQTIRKYHEEHEDGSITWGYENDDGSFKEETIGVDCVTRGKYGYFDPDGVKREYTYQTGIPCDRPNESEEAASNQGFIDYTNNKYVLPNGDQIDLEAMVKNRARKPVHQPRYTSTRA